MEMKYKVSLEGHDGMFLSGGNPLYTWFECDDRFLDHCISLFGDDIDYLLHEAGEEISMFLYADVEMDDETAQDHGYPDADAAWEASHKDGIYYYEDPDLGFKVKVNSVWKMQDTLALTTGAAIAPHLRKAFENRLASKV